MGIGKSFLYMYFIFRANDTFTHTSLAYHPYFIWSLIPLGFIVILLVSVPFTMLLTTHASYILAEGVTDTAHYCVLVVDDRDFDYLLGILAVGSVFDVG